MAAWVMAETATPCWLRHGMRVLVCDFYRWRKHGFFFMDEVSGKRHGCLGVPRSLLFALGLFSLFWSLAKSCLNQLFLVISKNQKNTKPALGGLSKAGELNGLPVSCANTHAVFCGVPQ